MKSTNQLLNEEPLSKDVGVIRNCWNWTKTKGVAISVFLSFLTLSLILVPRDPPSFGFWYKISQEELPIQGTNTPHSDVAVEKMPDRLLGGLLLPGLDERSCESRYRSNFYRRPRPIGPPSSYLISKLRNYEALQKQCGPNTAPYNNFLQDLKSGTRDATNSPTCKYVIFNPFNGMGNRMLTVGAAFLYALLTDRVMFIGDEGDMEHLFCEPFPEVSWWLPSDFPLTMIRKLRPFTPYNRYRHFLQNGTFRNSSVPLFLYFNLGIGHDDNEKNFFCDHDQALLQQVPLLVLRSEVYFSPSLFLIPSFQEELNNLFPEKETVFHHLGRYLFHPSNSAWGIITRYYDAYLAKADEILGLQIRVGSREKAPFVDQTLTCAINANLLPNISNRTQRIVTEQHSDNQKTKVVLITSLTTSHFERIRNKYRQYATTTGEAIAFHQPSHDGHQKSQNLTHDSQALAEMYLLSFSDKLMITGNSTFGYIAHSLGGLRPWILDTPHAGQVPNPPCWKSLSLDPCYQFAPTFYECRNASRINSTAYHIAHVQRCEDIGEGLKLFD